MPLKANRLRNEIFARLDDQDYAWFKQYAEAQELSLSVLLRRMIQQVQQEELQRKGQENGPQG
jgi:hypothetical protein